MTEQRVPTPAKNQTGGVLIICPHPDDAAFSLGGSLHLLRRPLTLCTVFGRSNFTFSRLFDNDEAQVTAERREEDAVFAHKVGAELYYNELPEASLRWGSGFCNTVAARNAESIRTSIADDRSRIGDHIRTVLSAVLNSTKPDTALLPAAVGLHRDHLVVRDIGTEVVLNSSCSLAFYEDLPYADDWSREEVRRWMADVEVASGRKLFPVTTNIHPTLDQKLQLASIYGSQIDQNLLQKLGNSCPVDDCPTETIWMAGDLKSSIFHCM